MPDILLTTLNAKYAHAAFGLRYLHANLGDLRERTELLEFDISQRTVDVLEALLARDPKIVGVGVYIWNIEESTRLVGELKRVRPQITVVLGGPEVSYETDEQEIAKLADYVVAGEADVTFRRVCAEILGFDPEITKIRGDQFSSNRCPPPARRAEIIAAELPQFADLKLPYDLYTADDIAHRVIYVEASRGCPYECEFCLSSLDIPVRQAPVDEFLAAMESLLDRGVKQFKFVDRTFNLNLKTSRAILSFF
ncbi:MAG TPA: cobalamin-dependent protein, partial [Planctomycetaceae bacterium]